MAKRIIDLSIGECDIPDILESVIILDGNSEIKYVDEYEVPYEYEYEVFTSTRENESIPDVIEIKGLKGLNKVINNDDCLPDIGLLDYKDEELNLDLKGVTLRELYKEIFKKIF